MTIPSWNHPPLSLGELTGEVRYDEKGWRATFYTSLSCHAIYRKGGSSASGLASNVASTPAGQVAAMWNHVRFMETEARRQWTTLPLLTGQELADISAYLAGLGIRPPNQK